MYPNHRESRLYWYFGISLSCWILFSEKNALASLTLPKGKLLHPMCSTLVHSVFGESPGFGLDDLHTGLFGSSNCT